ncbi:N-6 DNA methylase, partial [bacterium]|nr:N-6 DNA methylase [bacterium]
GDTNSECRRAFIHAQKGALATTICVPEANRALAAKASRICYILRLLNITTLTAEHDYLGQLYETFFRFTGGNTIGQFFTPRHITHFMTNLCEVSKNDIVVDPTCGTGGFLVSALQCMMEGKPLTQSQIAKLVKGHLKGFESEPITAALCIVNMILRGDGKTGIINGNCFTHEDYPDGEATVLLGNPPFPHKKTDEPVEKFVDRGLEALKTRGVLAMIVPASLLVKNNKKMWRQHLLKENTLKAIITLPGELFQPYASSTTGILLIQRGIPHSGRTKTLFCRVEKDGYRLRKNVRVEEPGSQLLEAMKAYRTGGSVPGFCITKTIFPEEKEWSPGAFIELVDHSVETIKKEVGFLIRSLVVFHSLYAPELVKFHELLAKAQVTVAPYEDIVGRKAKCFGDRPDRIGTLFDVYYGQQELEDKKYLVPGPYPIISSQGRDNGCYGFFFFDEDYAKLISPPFATVPRTGSIGEAFVQTWPCGVTSDCLLLIPREGTDIEDLFIAATLIRLEKWRFNYARKITPERIAHMKVNRGKALKDWIRKRRAPAEKVMADALDALA